jgi:hypothetical protein
MQAIELCHQVASFLVDASFDRGQFLGGPSLIFAGVQPQTIQGPLERVPVGNAIDQFLSPTLQRFWGDHTIAVKAVNGVLSQCPHQLDRRAAAAMAEFVLRCLGSRIESREIEHSQTIQRGSLRPGSREG